MRNVIYVLILPIVLVASFVFAAPTAPRVLFLSSYHPAYPTFYPQIEGLKQVFDEKGVELDVEFMDSKRFYTKDNLLYFKELLAYKLSQVQPYDSLVVGDDNALVFALENKETLFKNLPIVFLGINNLEFGKKKADEFGLTGVLEEVSDNETISLMHRLLPNLGKAVFITDGTPTGKGHLARIVETMKMRGERDYEIIDLARISWDDFPTKIRNVGVNNAILLYSALKDSQGVSKTFEESLEIIIDNARCPTFHLFEHGIGDGILGGKIVSFKEQGRLAGELVFKIVQGDSPSSLPVVSGGDANVNLFDWNELNRFGIDKKRLPADTVLINFEQSFLEKNKALLLQAGGVIAFLVGIISYLLNVNRSKAAAEKRVRQSEERYKAYILGAPDGIFIYDSSATILQVNPAAAELTGYSIEELVGMSMFTLISSEDKEQAKDDFRSHHNGSSLSGSYDLLRKDGGIASVYYDSAHLTDETVIGFCKNVTEEKRIQNALEESEERFRGLLEQAGDAIFAFDRSGQLQFVNNAACLGLGYTHEELLRLRVWEVDPLAMERNDPETLWKLPSVTIESIHERKDGTTFPVEMRMGCISVGGKELVLGVGRDITERKLIESQILRESQINLAQAEVVRALTAPDATMQKIAGVVYDWVLQLTGAEYGYVGSLEPPSGGLLLHNVTAMQQKGCTVAKPTILLQKVGDSYPGLWGHSLNTGKGFYTNAAMDHPMSKGLPEGHLPVSKFLSVPCRYEGELVGQIGLANPGRDFVDDDLKAIEILAGLFALAVYRKRTDYELIKTKEAAEAANRSKSEFLANVSHELRTPLNAIFGMLQLLNTTEVHLEQSEYINTAISSSRNLLQVINDVLDLSKIEAGKIELAEDVFNLKDLITSVETIFKLQAEEKALVVQCSIQKDLDESYLGDEGRIRQILFNLVGNAIKFTEKGIISIDCKSAACPDSKHFTRLLFVITDTGIGIPEDKIESIFKAFEQVDGSYARRYQGTGLGLGIVKRFVELMGGNITVESTVGFGTTMAVTVLVKRNLESRELAVLAPEVLPKRSGKLTLLLAEDDRINRIAASRLLEKRGYVVDCATDGMEVLSKLELNDYDCVLMDVQMPGMDGMESTRAIRASKTLGDKVRIPIIALTAHAMKGDREKFLAVGMNDYLSKPMDVIELEKILTQVMNRREKD